MVAAVVVIAVLTVLVYDEAAIDMVVVLEVLIIRVLADVEIIVAGAIVIVLKLALPVSYSADASSSAVAVDLFKDALAGVDANVFAVAMTALDMPVPTPVEGFSLSAAFDCVLRALLNCARVLQA